MKTTFFFILSLATTTFAILIPPDLPDGEYNVYEHHGPPPMIERSANKKRDIWRSVEDLGHWWSFTPIYTPNSARHYQPTPVPPELVESVEDNIRAENVKSEDNEASPTDDNKPSPTKGSNPSKALAHYLPKRDDNRSGTGKMNIIVNDTAPIPHVVDVQTDAHPGTRAHHDISDRGCYTKIPYKLPAAQYADAKAALVNYCALYPFQQFHATVALKGQVVTYVCRRNTQQPAPCSEKEFEFYEAFMDHSCGALGPAFAWSRAHDMEYGRVWRGDTRDGRKTDSNKGRTKALTAIVEEEMKSPAEKLAEMQAAYNENAEKSKGFWVEDPKEMQKKFDKMQREKKEKDKKDHKDHGRYKKRTQFKLVNWKDDAVEDMVKVDDSWTD
ncbi:Fc.00g008120.m01.CDS01 [Cosmosporella sp. VM-42]